MTNSYSALTAAVNYAGCVVKGQPPKPNPALRALAGAHLLQTSALDIDTATRAAIVTGSTRQAVTAAQILLQTQDYALIGAVVRHSVPLMDAANTDRERARLIESFKAATPLDHAAFVAAIGRDVLFDTLVAA